MKPVSAGASPKPSRRSFLRFWLPVVLAALVIALVATLYPIGGLLLVLGVFVLAASLVEPGVLLTAILLLHMVGEPWRISQMSLSLGGINLYPNDLLVLGLVAIAFLQAFGGGLANKIPRDRVSLVVLAFFAYGVFSLVRSYPLHGFRALLSFRLQFFYAVLYFLILATMRNRRSRFLVLVGVWTSAAFVGLMGVWNVLTGHPTGGVTGSETYRYLSGLQAMTLSFALILLTGLVWTRRRPLWSLALGSISVIGFFVAQARSVWLAAAGGFLVAGLGSKRWRRILPKLAMAVAGVVILSLLPVNFLQQLPGVQDVSTRISSLTKMQQDPTVLVRTFLWLDALKELERDPVFGLGLGKEFIFYNPISEERDPGRQMHNSYLELAYFSGVIAVALLLAFQILVIARALRVARRTRDPARSAVLLALAGCHICLAGVSLVNVISSSLVATTYIWILSAITILEARDAEDVTLQTADQSSR